MINLTATKSRLARYHKIKAAQFEKPILLYHGSSSKYLRSILKHGLTPAAKEGRWVQEDENASEHNRSRISYGGVYFTNNLQTATSAASNLIIHQEGNWQDRKSNTIIVCAQIQPSSTIGDEDDYKGNLFNEMRIPETMIPGILAQLRAKLKSPDPYDGKRWDQQNTDYINKNVDALIAKYAPNYNLRQDKARLYPLAQEVLLTELERQVAYRSIRNGIKPHYSFERDAKQTVERRTYNKGGWPHDKPLPQAMRPQSKEKAEHRARSALDLFIKATKSYSKQNLEEQRDQTYTRGTTRTMDIVAYRGRNKITCIVEFADSKTDKYGTELILHYGTIPAEFKRQYVQSKGPWPKVMNKTGEVIEASVKSKLKYPIAISDDWYSDNDYKKRGGKLIEMYPDKYLSKVRPLKMDEESRENIDILKNHIKSGKTLDPVKIYSDGKEDGRHRAHAAKELGINKIPVIVFSNNKIEASGAQNSDKYTIKYVRTESDGFPGDIDYYSIDYNDKPIVPFRLTNLDHMLEIDIDDGYENRVNKLGPTVLRKLLKDIKKLYPKAEQLVGLRTTGARLKHGKAWDEASIKLQASLGKVYHYTSINNLKSILESKAFKLSTSLGTSSDQTDKENPFFLSLTRSKIGGFHSRSVGNNGVIMALDADYLQHNNKMDPHDYWGPAYRGVNQNMNEMEEKLTSKNQSISLPDPPTKLIHSVHILIKPVDSLSEPRWNYIARRALLECKRLKIPVYVYNNAKDWLSQRPQRSVPLSSITDQIKGPEPEREPQWPRSNYLEPWVELYLKPVSKRDELSKQAKSKLRYIDSEYRLQEAVTQLGNDIHNDRSSPNVAPLVRLVTKSGSIKKYLYDLHNKWFPDDILKVEAFTVNDVISLHKLGETETTHNPMLNEISHTHKYQIHQNGKPINARLTAIIDEKEPERAYLVIDGDEKHTLGPVGMRKVFRQIKKHLPQLKRAYGNRVTGARKKWNKPNKDVEYNLTKASL